MVTIEQKLTLFSKLLNQEIREETDDRLNELEAEYEKRIAENKFEVDKEAAAIIEQARKRAELKKVELISKGKLSSKKEMMLIKEELMTRFMGALEDKILAFTQTERYRKYLVQLIKALEGLNESEHNLEIYLTQRDYEENQDFIKANLIQAGLKENLLSFHMTDEGILGGLIIKDPIHNTRIDESIREILNDKKDEIIEKISIAIGEVGEVVHE